MRLQGGTNRRELDRRFLAAGGEIEPVHGTGELRYRHPKLNSVVRVNGRRKDAPRHLVSFVNKLGL